MMLNLKSKGLSCALLLVISPTLLAEEPTQTNPKKMTEYERAIEREKQVQDMVKAYEEAETKKHDDLQKAKTKQAALDQNCQTAKARLTELNQHGRVRQEQKDGSYRVLTPEEKNKEVEDAQAAIQKFCP